MSIADLIVLFLATIGAAFVLFLVAGAIAACMLSSEISQRERREERGFYDE